MTELKLVVVFWETEELDDAQAAVITVDDGTVVHIKRADGFEVRLLMHELEALFDLAINEVTRHQEMESGQPTPTLP